MAIHWPASTIGEIVDCGRGEVRTGPFGSQLHRTDYVLDTAGVPVVMPKDMSGGYVDYSSIARISAEKANSLADHITRPGDILVARRGVIGRCAFIRECDGGVLCGTGCIRVSTQSTDLDPAFLHRFLMLPRTAAQLEGMAVGSTMANLNAGIVRSLEVPLPPLHMQARISSILSAYDELIENNTRRIKILEEMAQAIYREWFVEFRFPGHEGVRMVDSELGPIPEGWAMSSIGSVTLLISRGVSPRYDDKADARVVNQRCIRGGWLSMEPSRPHSTAVPQSKQLEVGDVLINSTGTGTLGRVAQVLSPLPETTVDSHVTIVRPDVAMISVEYLGMNLTAREDEFASMATGSTGQTELGRGRIADTCIPVPHMATQELFSELVRPMRALSVLLRTEMAVLRGSRDLLLPHLISGEIDVSNLDIGNAEPAA